MPWEVPAPLAFDDIRRAWDANRMAQAYVLVGSVRGSALSLARRIIALLFCQSSDKPCGTCPGCKGAKDGRLSDVYMLEPIMVAQQIGVEETRALCHFIGQTSFAGGWKVGMLLYADRMTPSAANAFLKMLEEPPPRTLFLLLTDKPHGLMPTILSRCQKVVLPSDREALTPWIDVVAGMMGDKGLGGLAGLAAAAGLGEILEIKRKEIEDAEEAAMDDASGTKDDEDKLKARITARYKEARTLVLQALLLWQRDVLAAVSGSGQETWFFAAHEASIRAQAKRLTVPQALARIDAVEEMQTQLDQNINEAVVLEAGFSRLME
jgi:DNA polymerase-3 subunit delta'